LSTGKTYQLRVEARNAIGFSNPSNVIEGVAAIVPAAPAAPSTILDINNVVVDWTASLVDSTATYGAPILGYKVFIRW
jgi:hypothetical protein